MATERTTLNLKRCVVRLHCMKPLRRCDEREKTENDVGIPLLDLAGT